LRYAAHRRRLAALYWGVDSELVTGLYCHSPMRSIVALLLVLSVACVLLTPSVEDDVDGTPSLSFVGVRSDGLAVESNLQSLECSPLIASARQPKISHVAVSFLRC